MFLDAKNLAGLLSISDGSKVDHTDEEDLRQDSTSTSYNTTRKSLAVVSQVCSTALNTGNLYPCLQKIPKGLPIFPVRGFWWNPAVLWQE